jgi:hypothetical protein
LYRLNGTYYLAHCIFAVHARLSDKWIPLSGIIYFRFFYNKPIYSTEFALNLSFRKALLDLAREVAKVATNTCTGIVQEA